MWFLEWNSKNFDLPAQQLIKAIRIEPDHDFIPNQKSGSGMALILLHQILYRRWIKRHIPLLEHDPSLREEVHNHMAGRSAGLGENHDLRLRWFSIDLFHVNLTPLFKGSAVLSYSYSISNVILAVFSNIADTEQYLSFERFTASSIDFLATFPRTL